jgi:hypothetical protein
MFFKHQLNQTNDIKEGTKLRLAQSQDHSRQAKTIIKVEGESRDFLA